MKRTFCALSMLLLAGCGDQSEQPLIQGPIRFLEVKTGENRREGGGCFTDARYGRLYRDYLLVTRNPSTEDEYTEVIPANRIWKVEFNKKSGVKPTPPASQTSTVPSADSTH
ncbi:hypothetical protein Mal52_31440 [Symmachiella dynata]|uniref:Lipoprotein n=1 Tax=Symmachiella dynata TaxID=2527995 RepID=A0A517ZQB5_9PLAN|nr:hypothetical protein [Symmachiella dynata]QDU44658.1 hypothetical protein Mal52_31440 [Symmachiella dynata]